MLIEAVSLQKSGDMSALALKTSLEEAKTVASKAMTVSDGVNIDGEQQVGILSSLSC